MRVHGLLTLPVILLALGCSNETDDPEDVTGIDGTQVRFAVDADFAADGAFYDFPFPSDARLLEGGQPDYRGFPFPADNSAVATLVEAAMDRPGFPVLPVAHFRFDGPLPALDLTGLYQSADDPILLVDVDPDSAHRGQVYPARAVTLRPDGFVAEHMLGVGPYPGIVLDPDTTYAVVIRRGLGDAAGEPLGVPAPLLGLSRGTSPGGDRGDALLALYTPMYETLDTLGVERDDVAAATVFTTGDVVGETKAMSDAIVDEYDVTIDGLQLANVDNPRICELHGTITMPAFQVGTPPFPTNGRFEVVDGVPQQQGTETVDVAITIPKTEMPAGGYPFVLYIHGSGGVSTQLIDRGKIESEGGMERAGEGPAFVLAEHGIASAGAAMPINPQRVPSAAPYDYINLTNPGAFSYTFRQGTFEQRLFLEALEKLTIDPQLLATCTGATLPAGETAFKFDFSRLGAMGQSMGAEYTNLLAAVEPKVQIVAPTGAGGHWSHFLDTSPLFGGVDAVAADVIGIAREDVRYLHPGLAILQNAWEAGDALPSLPRIAQRPFEGHPSRHVYTPVAPGDLYWHPEVFDAMALGYGTQQAGDAQWDMQSALALIGNDGVATLPVSDNRESRGGAAFTGIVVHYEGDGNANPHTIFSQLDEVKYQYGCFFQSYVATGTATVPAPAALGTPCPN